MVVCGRERYSPFSPQFIIRGFTHRFHAGSVYHCLLQRLGLVALLSTSIGCFAQTNPTEFAEMSLQDLLETSIDISTAQSPAQSGWHIAYRHKLVEFDGYLDGDRELGLTEVRWDGQPESRTSKNFPIVPTRIRQQAHIVNVGYQYSDDLRLHLSLPYIRQETDHVSIVPGYEDFMIATEGLGDTQVSASYKFVNAPQQHWWFSVGLSVPTGSIDEQGDTPRAPGNQQLPYTMQLGSGTFDVPVELGIQLSENRNLSLKLGATIRTGKNDRQYRLGNNYVIGGSYTFELSQDLKALIGAEFEYRQAIHGGDDSLLVSGVNPHPASLTNPNNYGGRKLCVGARLSWVIASQIHMIADYGKPVYQQLNGPQLEESWRSGIQFSLVL